MKQILIVTDIFGVCAASDELNDFIRQLGAATVVVDPYQGEELGFVSEQQAYPYFVEQMGHPEYALHVRDKVQQYRPDLIIGFSAGAVALIEQSSELLCPALCFYPSRINQTSIHNLTTSMQLVLAKEEASYNVLELAKKLASIKPLTIIQSQFPHGFINQSSAAFSIDAKKYGYAIMQDFVQNG